MQMKWLPDMDLNHDKQIQSLLCYRYTIGQDGTSKLERFEKFFESSQVADMAQEYKLILKHADEPGYTPDIECYLRHGGYDDLKKALAIPPKDLPTAKNFRRRNKSART
jgi:hypothetical protein